MTFLDLLRDGRQMLTLNKGEGTSFNSTSQGVQMKTITSSSNSSKFKQKTTSQAKLELECCVRECVSMF